jgi:phospholipase C
MPYDAYAASPVHRFYQMWQQLDCDVLYSTRWNPSGCRSDLFPWVEVTIGAGSNGLAQPANFSTEYSPNAKTTGEGSTSMGFYNVLQGDAPYLKSLADNYAMSDNFHQAVMGGTGANHVMLGTGDAIWFSDGHGNPTTPPHNQLPAPTTGTQKMVTVAAVSAARFLAAGPTPTASIRVLLAQLPYSTISAICQISSILAASQVTSIF